MNKYRSGFHVMVTGQVEGCKMAGADNLYCKYSFNYGVDWAVVHGLEHGISQICRKSSGAHTDVLTWNYPMDITFRSTNVHGWPQIVVSVYGINLLGKDVIRGYGCTHLPVNPGRHVRYVRLYTPVSSSWCQSWCAWLSGNPAEFFDAKFVAQGRGREVTRVQSRGTVKIVIQVSTKSMTKWDYVVDGERHVEAPMDEGMPRELPMPQPAVRQRKTKAKTSKKAVSSESDGDTSGRSKPKAKKKAVAKKKKKPVSSSSEEDDDDAKKKK